MISKFRFVAVAIFLCLITITSAAQPDQYKKSSPPRLPSMREQAEIQQGWLKLRLERVLPELMRKHNVSMWLVICREYNEDPAFRSLTSPTVFAARRRTILAFFDQGREKGVERLALGGGSNGGLYRVYRDPEVENRELWGEGQWALLRKLIAERDPKTIAINISHTHAFSDGLSAGEWEKLQQTLGQEYLKRVVRAELLPLEYVETRLPEMLPIYKQMMEIVHWIIERAFSNEVIKPGKTTNQDVVWWMRQQVNDLGLGTWFQPSVRVQRKGSGAAEHPGRRRSRSDRARRCLALRFRNHRDGVGHRHSTHGLHAARRRNGRSRRRQESPGQYDAHAGHPDGTDEARP